MSSLVERTDQPGLIDRADLELQFNKAPDNKTYISHQFGRYPFHVCRAQYLDKEPAGMATVYLQSSAGGLFEHDDLSCNFHGLPNSEAHITTQASTIVHGMKGGNAKHTTTICAEENSLIEYLPDPVILFPDSELFSSVNVELHPNSTVILSDGFTYHDPDQSGRCFQSNLSELKVQDTEGKMLCLDRYTVSGEQFKKGELGVMGENKIQATFFIFSNAHCQQKILEKIRTCVSQSTNGYAGVSILPNNCGIMVRLVANEAHHARQILSLLWQTTRLQIKGELPLPRRK